ncbi:hypothetical protein J4441_02115 [Candidatus Micrarchaeota archaeon]|nr:hypothetical protein [Candidatus Micrarchaeota archaeon]
MIEIIAVSALMGFFAKLTDESEDRGIFGKAAYLFAAAYGAFGAYLSSALGLASLWVATAFANVLAKKIDGKFHALGLVVFVLGTLALGISEFSIPLFMFLLFFAALDEINLPGGKTDMVSTIISRRLSLVIATLLVALVFGVWEYFASIAAFDVAYFASAWSAAKLYPHGKFPEAK